jgi:geranylgeranyl diphosphate synthase type II
VTADTATSDSRERLVQQVLHEYGELTRQQVRRYLPRSEPASYLYDLVADYPRRGGKMLRPCLCIAAARAFGAYAEDAVASAASIELLHNALLVHDDIADGSDRRRGIPTLHTLHGVPLALNAGDALALLSLDPLTDNFARLGNALTLRIFAETAYVARETTEGQALELGWCRDNRTDLVDKHYLEMVLKKTCWLTTIHPLRIGCLIGTRGCASDATLSHLIRLGFFFGAAFQIQDDLLNLESTPAYGKELNGDLLEGKRTLMLIHAMRKSGTKDRKRLVRTLAKPRCERTPQDVTWMRALIDDTGSMDHARSVARGLAGAALYEYERVFDTHAVSNSRDARFIRTMVTWVLQRQT